MQNRPWSQYLNREWLIFATCLLLIVTFYFSLGVTGPLFLIAWFMAYLSFPFVQWLEQKGLSRSQSAGLTIAIACVLLFGVIALLGPWLYQEVKQLIQELPGMLSWLSDRINEFIEWASERLNIEGEVIETGFHETWASRLQNFEITDLQFLGPFLTSGFGFFLFFIQLILLPIFYIYLLFHFDRIPALVERMIPAQVLPTYRRYVSKFDRLILGYLQGMFLVCCFLAFCYSLGLSISGVKFGVIVGILAGMLSFVPYLGFFFGISISALLILIYSSGWAVWLGYFLTFGVTQLIESYYLTPRLVGSRVGLNPIVVILLVIAGANVAGLAGMIIAIPLGAMLWIILDDLLVAKQQTEKGDLPD